MNVKIFDRDRPDPDEHYADYLHADKFEARWFADLGREATFADLTDEELTWFAYGIMPSECRCPDKSDRPLWCSENPGVTGATCTSGSDR